MRVLLTGSAGFIGTAVDSALRAAGHEVRGFDVLHPAAHGRHPGLGGHGDEPWESIPDPVFADAGEVALRGAIFGDVRDPVAVADAMRGVDAVVHQAAMVGMSTNLAEMPEYASNNDLGTAVLLATMAQQGVYRLVLASSMVVYGEGAYSCDAHGPMRPTTREVADLADRQFEHHCGACGAMLAPGPVTEDAPLQPRSVYAATKAAQEYLAGAWAQECGATAIALRYHNVYGPGMPRDTPYAGVAAIFRSSVANGEPAQVYEDGAQQRDFIHVSDVAQANVVALTAELGPGLHPFNVASGRPRTIGELAEALTDALGGPPPHVTHRFRTGDVRHIVASPDRARDVLGFSAKYDFRTGMAELASAHPQNPRP